ncbi:nucleotidyltransferase family protein [Herbiconiux sp. CPCC 203407]|uniref:Nucleotidyltransferase family protein n=1 Tax=Herbiconiux oxytropis TaxID=2970915 RepID=A0AA41XJW2_9MICO|nr:nucleotidyltransferase family protein [Herbiconiux oxytropis]MCS5722452.1 nucleotidyltransferase family protein [Herbiconiux oxytropis]MCS5727615.1 nucleotidyltransferase family protein [Herbiconiux oxytropis]
MNPPPAPGAAAGILLAAGAGRRMGGPKALVVPAAGEGWLHRGVRVLLEAGCDPVVVVLGASADDAAELLRAGFADELAAGRVRIAVATAWEEGLGASLRTGIAAVRALTAVSGISAVAITLVDLPELEGEAVRRLLQGAGPTTLRQAFYEGRPGHPVVVGAEHLPALTEALAGDEGARPYLRAHGVEEVDCSDLGGGSDVDTPG